MAIAYIFPRLDMKIVEVEENVVGRRISMVATSAITQQPGITIMAKISLPIHSET